MNPYLKNLCRRGPVCSVTALFLGLTLAATSLDARWSRPSIPDHRSIVVFGDSLSDTGRTYSIIGVPPAPYYYAGRTSNGPLWVEYLAPAMGMAYNPADNFAWAGANTGTLNVFPGLEGTGMLDQLEEYLDGPPSPAWSRVLKTYVVFGGSNDFIRILSGGEDPFDVIPEAVANIAVIVQSLQNSGARQIVVVDLPDIGLTPRDVRPVLKPRPR